MDEYAMMDLTTLPLTLTLPVCFLAGLGLGTLYFHALRRTADLIVRGGRPLLGLALTFARLGMIAAGFYMAVQLGGGPLLATLAGVLIAKVLVLRLSNREPA